jgi:hypothetical protein
VHINACAPTAVGSNDISSTGNGIYRTVIVISPSEVSRIDNRDKVATFSRFGGRIPHRDTVISIGKSATKVVVKRIMSILQYAYCKCTQE